MQLNALRYQSEVITNVQRAWLTLDLLAVILFFRRNAPNGSPWPSDVRARGRRWALVLIQPTVVAAINTIFLNVVPESADPRIVRYDPRWLPHFPLSVLILQPFDWLACPHLNWGCRFLRVEHRTLMEKVWDNKVMVSIRTDGSDSTRALAGVEGVVLRERSLRFAVLTESRLYGADMTDVDLRQAELDSTSLQGARLSDAQMQGAVLIAAQMQGADLSDAWMHGADLRMAHLWQARAPADRPSDIGLADLRAIDLETPLSHERQAALREACGVIPAGRRRQEAERRLGALLSPKGEPPTAAFQAGPDQPILVTGAVQPVFPNDPT